MKFYVDAEGNYVGAFEGIDPPEGSVEVPSAPADARQVWDGEEWGPVPPPLRLSWHEFRDLIPPLRRNELVMDSIAAGVFGFLLEFVADATEQGVVFSEPRVEEALGFLLQQALITQEEHDALLQGQALSAPEP